MRWPASFQKTLLQMIPLGAESLRMLKQLISLHPIFIPLHVSNSANWLIHPFTICQKSWTPWLLDISNAQLVLLAALETGDPKFQPIHRKALVGRYLKDHWAPTLCHKHGCQLLDHFLSVFLDKWPFGRCFGAKFLMDAQCPWKTGPPAPVSLHCRLSSGYSPCALYKTIYNPIIILS